MGGGVGGFGGGELTGDRGAGQLGEHEPGHRGGGDAGEGVRRGAGDVTADSAKDVEPVAQYMAVMTPATA